MKKFALVVAIAAIAAAIFFQKDVFSEETMSQTVSLLSPPGQIIISVYNVNQKSESPQLTELSAETATMATAKETGAEELKTATEIFTEKNVLGDTAFGTNLLSGKLTAAEVQLLYNL